MLSRCAFLVVLGAGLIGLVAGCGTPGSANAANASIPVAASTAQLRPGDSLSISLQGVPDPSTNPVQIDDQGLISLPYIGTLTAAGVSTAELSQRVRETYISKKIYTTL